MTVKQSEIGIMAVTAQGSIRAIYLQPPVMLRSYRDIVFLRLCVKSHLSEFQVERTANVSGGLRIPVKTTVKGDALQVSTFHITGHWIHLIGAGIKNLHAVDSRRDPFRLHPVHDRLPGISPTSDHLHALELQQMFLHGGHTSLVAHLTV